MFSPWITSDPISSFAEYSHQQSGPYRSIEWHNRSTNSLERLNVKKKWHTKSDILTYSYTACLSFCYKAQVSVFPRNVVVKYTSTDDSLFQRAKRLEQTYDYTLDIFPHP